MKILTLDVFLSFLILSIIYPKPEVFLTLGLNAHRKVGRQGVIRLRISKGGCMLYVVALISLNSVFCRPTKRYDFVTSFCILLVERRLGLQTGEFHALEVRTFIPLILFVLT